MKKSKNLYITAIAIIAVGITLACGKDNANNDPTKLETGSVQDGEGNIYKTVKIGDQWWMAENLKATKYRDGDQIPNVTGNTEWAALTTPAYCSYSNNYSTYGNIYGLLYNWYSVDPSSNGNKSICPEGWHIPSDAELSTLITYLGGVGVAGGKLKEVSTTHWNSPNTGATNSSGFTALAGGFRSYTDGSFQYIGVFGHFWSSTQGNVANQAWNLGLFNIETSADHSISVKKLGFSIRCIKDN